MNQKNDLHPLFKGIALFTPSGDLVYGIDPNKRRRWHINLCSAWQEILGLPEPPHFLVPGYTATIDRWRNPQTQEIQTSAEVYPAVQRHQALLNRVFGLEDVVWQVASWQEEACDPILLQTYRNQFPQLWEEHDLIVRFNEHEPLITSSEEDSPILPVESSFNRSGYVLRLFVSGTNSVTEVTLQNLRQLLEQNLHSPYTLKIIDIFKHPEQAEINQVSATPTLVRVWPRPVRRIVGELNNLQRVVQILTTG